jgi:type II secretory pathway component PulK
MKKNSSNSDRRTGAILAVALVLLTITMIIGAAIAKSMLLFHQQANLSENRQQAFWLAESGYQRARLALSEDEDYQGETWRVPGQILGAGSDGVVVIRVEQPATEASGQRIIVEAKYPEHETGRFVVRRERTVKHREE